MTGDQYLTIGPIRKSVVTCPEDLWMRRESKCSFRELSWGGDLNPRRYFRLAVTLKDERRIIGDCVCRSVDPDNMEDLSRIIGQAYIGYYLDRKFWRHGYATEVASALLAYGFGALGLEKMWAWCDTENLASVRVLEKVGMNREAHFRKSVLVQGEWRDCFVYGLLKDEFH